MESGSSCKSADPMASWMESGENGTITLLLNTCAGRPNRGCEGGVGTIEDDCLSATKGLPS